MNISRRTLLQGAGSLVRCTQGARPGRANRAAARVRERLAKAKITIGDSVNRLRVSPSVFNDQGDVDRLLAALA